MKKQTLFVAFLFIIDILCIRINAVQGATFDSFTARPPIHAQTSTSASPQGLSPKEVKLAYHLGTEQGAGTIAIISAFKHPNIESDLKAFSAQFMLPSCTVANKCLEIHAMSSSAKVDTGWSLETALDSQWAHAVAPKAKILVVEAVSDSGTNLINAINYARSRKDVVSISMSWGGDEFGGETALDKYFASSTIPFFASSGDEGSGASWPAVSPYVIAVGGTSLKTNVAGNFLSEKAWPGSGGGISAYEPEPAYQSDYDIPRTNKKRAIPDVSYAADPSYGFSVYHAPDTSSTVRALVNQMFGKNWYVVGGTSAGAPQWAAIASLAAEAKKPVSLLELYKDKASATYSNFFRDITSGTNGDCVYYCVARKHFDYVTGLGSPVTDQF